MKSRLWLLPLAVMGGALWSPMANVMIFGLLMATVVGLIFTPVLHALFFGIRWQPPHDRKEDE